MREAKKRSIKHQTGENAVQMRLHRRSVEQKSKRDEIFCKGRQGLNVSSLQPVIEETEVVEKPTNAQAKDARQEMLQRWKNEKKLKTKLKSEKIAAKPFRITKINHSGPIFLFSEKQVNGQPITASAASAMNASMRVTRSKANTFMQPKAQPVKRIPPARVLKLTKPLPEPAGPAKKVSKPAKGPGKPAVKKPQPCETATSSSSIPDTEVTRVKREPSFAPFQFSFKAPKGISPFFFQTKTIEVEKLLPQLTVVSNVCPIVRDPQFASPDASSKPDDSVPKTDDEAVFKTPHSVNTKIRPLKISPLLENNPWICETRGKPPSSKKSTPRRSRTSEAHTPLPALQLELQPVEGEDINPELVNSPLKDVKATESNVSPVNSKSNEPTPSRQLRARTPAKSTVDRSSSGFVLTPSYFRNMLEDHTGQLKSLCTTWQDVMEREKEHISENVTGRIRTTIGQSELLMAERFKQFSGLIDDCELGRGEKVTTCVDLQGFWEMIFFQVEDVKAKFEFLEKIKSANWAEMATPMKPVAIVKRVLRRVPKPEVRPKSGAAAQAARQRLAEAKAKAAQLRKAAKNRSPEDQVTITEAKKNSSPLHVQEIVPDRQVESDESVSPSHKISNSRPRRSLRSSLQAITLAPIANETSALLLPVPVLENLSLNSPVVSRSPSKRLSELFSPLSGARKATIQTLATINDDDDSEMVSVEQVDTTIQKPFKSIVSPQKRMTRSSNLIRFSGMFSAPADPGAEEKENANFVLT